MCWPTKARSGNIKDSLVNGEWQGVPAKLVEALRAQGWIHRHNYDWDKGNVLSSATNRLRDTHEHLFGFVKVRSGSWFGGKAARKEYADGRKLPKVESQRRKVHNRSTLTEAEKAEALAEIDRRHADGRDYRIRLRGDKANHRDSASGDGGARARELAKRGFYFQGSHPDGAMLGSVLRFPMARDEVHPCPFHVSLPAWCIRVCCPKGGTVLDCFMGSGTTGVAALKLERTFIGIETNTRYVQRAWAKILQTEPNNESAIEGKVEPDG